MTGDRSPAALPHELSGARKKIGLFGPISKMPHIRRISSYEVTGAAPCGPSSTPTVVLGVNRVASSLFQLFEIFSDLRFRPEDGPTPYAYPLRKACFLFEQVAHIAGHASKRTQLGATNKSVVCYHRSTH